jgi:hypothetical protein
MGNVPSIRKIGGMIVDHTPTQRVKSYEHMSAHALLCAAAGRHLGFLTNDPVCAEVEGWGRIRALEVHYRCDCTRWRYEVVDADTAETISRSTQYGGGELLEPGANSQREAKKVWLDQVQERRRAAIAAADEQAQLEARAAVAAHKAEVAKKPRRTRRKTGPA